MMQNRADALHFSHSSRFESPTGHSSRLEDKKVCREAIQIKMQPLKLEQSISSPLHT